MNREFAGRLRTRLALERWVEAGGTPGWRPDGELWGDVTLAPERPLEGAEAERFRTRLKVRLRPADVDATCRVTLDGRIYAVLAARRDPSVSDRMELLVEEQAA